MTPQDKFQIITRELQEVVDAASLQELLAKKDPVIYGGTVLCVILSAISHLVKGLV